MRSPTLLLALLWASRSLSLDFQLPLGGVNHQSPSPLSADAPAYRSDLLSLHKSLVSIESISGRELAVGDFIADYLFDKGWMSTIQFVPPRENTPEGIQRLNIIAWPDSKDAPEPKVLLTSHIDTVPPFIPYKIEDGEVTKSTRISGRGSVDAKASVAAMIIALDELVKKNQVGGDDVMLLFVVGEEVSGDGMRWFNDSLDEVENPPRFDAVIFGEPTESKLACGHKGALFCSISVEGQGGHSGYPWLGKSANEVIIRALAKVVDADLGNSDKYGNTTVNVGRLEGGVAENVIPEHAEAGIMVRVAQGPQADGHKIVQKRIQAILDEVDEDAITFECSQGYGFVESNCEVEGVFIPGPRYDYCVY